MKKNVKFPVLGLILLVVGLIWFFNEAGVWNIDIPWWPIILIAVAIGIIVNRYTERGWDWYFGPPKKKS